MSAPRYLLQTADDLARAGRGWLTPRELDVAAGFRFDKPRDDWRLGRLTAKRALAHVTGVGAQALDRIEILAAADGAPEPSLDGEPANAAISLSHSHATGLCLVSTQADAVGCDIECIETRRAVFVDTFFTRSELERWERTPRDEQDLLATLIWSAKESALKVLRTGLSLDTRDIEIDVSSVAAEPGWHAFGARYDAGGRVWSGWWARVDNFVLTAIADPDGGRPEPLG